MKTKVTIEFPDGQTHVFDDFEVLITQERGYAVIYGEHGEPADYMPNGHARMLIKMWKGCHSFEDYQQKSEAILGF